MQFFIIIYLPLWSWVFMICFLSVEHNSQYFE